MGRFFLPLVLALAFAACTPSGAGAPTSFAAQACFNERNAQAAQAEFNFCDQAIRAGGLSDADLSRAYAGRGRANRLLGHYALGLVDLDRAIELDGHDDLAFAERGEAHVSAGRGASGLADFDHAIALAPRNGDYLNEACWTRALMNRELDRAEADCTKAVGYLTGAEQANALDSRGLVHLKQHKCSDAFEDYNAAVTLTPASAHYLYGRALASLCLGDRATWQRDAAAAAHIDDEIAATYADYGVDEKSVLGR